MENKFNRSLTKDGTQDFELKRLNNRIDELRNLINGLADGEGGLDLSSLNEKMSELARVDELPFTNVDSVVIPCSRQLYHRVMVIDNYGSEVMAQVIYNPTNTTVLFSGNASGKIIIKY